MSEIAIVTGASRGIGRAIAVRLARDGYRVAINDLPSAKVELEKLRDEITSSGGLASTFYADVSVEDEVEKMVRDVVQALGGLDVVCETCCSVSLHTFIPLFSLVDDRQCWDLHSETFPQE